MDCKYLNEFGIEWHIRNFSRAIRDTKKTFKSPSFSGDTRSGIQWHLSLNLWTKGSEKYIGIYMTRDDYDFECVRIPIKFTIELKTACICIQERRVSLASFFERDTTWGFDRFMKWSSLLENMNTILLHDDTLSVYCKVYQVGSTEYFSDTITEREKLGFDWTIENWREFNHLSNDKKEVEFKGKNKASFLFYIYGDKDGDKDFIIRLTKVAPKGNGFLTCRISILDAHGCEALLQETCHHFFEDLNVASNILFPGEKIHDSYMKDGSLTLRFIMSMTTRQIRRIAHEMPDEENDEILKGCYECMYQHSILCDVKAKAGNTIVSCHRYILCKKSPVLKNKRIIIENKCYKSYFVIDFDDIDGDTLQKMVNFMYSDELNNLDYESAMKLFEAGHKYHINSLKEKCSSVLKTCFSFQNVFDILVVAQKCKDGALKRSATHYFAKHYSRLHLTAEWKSFDKTEPTLADELLYFYRNLMKGT